MRKLSLLDKIIGEIDSYNKVMKKSHKSEVPSPSKNIENGNLTSEEKQLSANLMRVDYTGEVCAQALYRGQAFVAKEEHTKAHLYQSAQEEYNHLAWCGQRLDELNDNPSLLNPFWYWSSFTIGAVAGSISDAVSYGFVVETEKQVMKHLDSHLKSLPINDNRSREILKQMYLEESEHAINASKEGAINLPFPIKLIMKAQSKVMTTLAYRI